MQDQNNLPRDELRQIAREAFTKAAQEATNLSVAGFLNRKHMAAWLDCSPASLDKMVKDGLPRVDRDGFRLYSKQAAIQWLRQYQH